MAIIKDCPTPFGVTASYHRLDRVDISSQAGECVLHVASYASEEARRAGSQPLSVERVTVPFWRLLEDLRVPFYRLLEQFEGSPVFGGESDVVVESGPTLELAPYTPPPPPPVPTATSGPESVPGFIPVETNPPN